MKKVCTKMFAPLLVLIFVFTTVAFAIGTEVYLEEELPITYAPHDRVLSAYSALRTAFVVNYDGSVTYPDDFAGAWIDNYVLHIATAPGLSENSIYSDLLQGYECVVVFVEANFSLNDLNQIRHSAFYLLLEEDLPVIGHHVNVRQNQIDMSFLSLDERVESVAMSSLTNRGMISYLTKDTDMSEVDMFNAVIADEGLFVFSIGELIDLESVELRGGMYIRRGSATGPRRTLGISGNFTSGGVSHNGIITAGHNFTVSGTNQLVYRGGAEFGRVGLLMYQDGALGDWAAVRLTNNDRLSNKIFGSSSSVTRAITATLDDVPIGWEVGRFGYMSGYGRAEIIAQNATMTSSSGFAINGLTRGRITQGTSQGGDSGGPYSLAHNGRWTFVGIHAGSSVAGGGNTVVFTPVVRFRNWFTVRTN